MPKHYWLVHSNGGKQWIDPEAFDLEDLARSAPSFGGRLIVEEVDDPLPRPEDDSARSLRVLERELELENGRSTTVHQEPPRNGKVNAAFNPPPAALGHIFRLRLESIHKCKRDYDLELNPRPTSRVLGGYYKNRALIRVYTVDSKTGKRSVDELFETFLHEVAHHLEYTEPATFAAKRCGRKHGTMHSDLFWRILGTLKRLWAERSGAKTAPADQASEAEHQREERRFAHDVHR
jgi:hypothetical protein